MKLIWMQPYFPAAVLKYTKFPEANALAVVVAPLARFEMPAARKEPPEVSVLKAGELAFLNTVAFLVHVSKIMGDKLVCTQGINGMPWSPYCSGIEEIPEINQCRIGSTLHIAQYITTG